MIRYDNLLNNIFSNTNFSSFIEHKRLSCFCELVRRYIKDPDGKTNGELISEIYSEIKKNHRNEYYYKNTVLNNLLCRPDHDYKSTIAFSELPVSNSIADFVLLNGKANVYEIKTEFDNFTRLKNQLQDYLKAFPYVSVITSMSHLNNLLELQKGTFFGIFLLHDNGKLEEIKTPKKCVEYLDAQTMFNMLHKKEYEDLLNHFCIMPKNISDFTRYTKCLEVFKTIPMENLYPEFIKLLKRREKIEYETFVSLPEEIRAVSYFGKYNRNKIKKLNNFLNSSFGE